jgi:hypothetical protein
VVRSILPIIAAFVVPYVIGTAFYPAYAVERRRRMWILILTVLVLAPLPLLVPGDLRWLRFCAVLGTLLIGGKLFDLHQQREPVPDVAEFLRYLVNPFTAVWRKLDAEPRYSALENLQRFAAGFAAYAIGAWLFWIVYAADVSSWPFVLEHAVKLALFYLALYGGLTALTALVRLCGVRARDPLHNPFIAVTPADFWRRYNRVVGQTLHENVFMRVGGLRRPVRATLITFAWSAALHEYVFGIVLEKIEGYQTAFFMIQGLAVAATLRVRPKGAMQPLAIASTIVFNIATATLFFESADQVLPFWMRSPFR